MVQIKIDAFPNSGFHLILIKWTNKACKLNRELNQTKHYNASFYHTIKLGNNKNVSKPIIPPPLCDTKMAALARPLYLVKVIKEFGIVKEKYVM